MPSTRRFGVSAIDYVDLYQIHRFDYDTPIEETLEALNDVVRAGKARYIGASSMYAWQFAKMLARRGRARLDALRLDAEPLQPGLPRGGARDAAAVPRGRRRRDPVAARWRAGFLAGDRKPGGGGDTVRANSDKLASRFYFADTDFAIADRVGDTAERRGVSRMQVALAWMLVASGRDVADYRRVQARLIWTKRSTRSRSS